MSTPDIRSMILDTTKPHLVNLRDMLRGEIEKLRSDMNNIMPQVHALVDPLAAAFAIHIANTNNPHSVRPSQIMTFSAARPNNALGNPGDVWVQYHTITVDQM